MVIASSIHYVLKEIQWEIRIEVGINLYGSRRVLWTHVSLIRNLYKERRIFN